MHRQLILNLLKDYQKSNWFQKGEEGLIEEFIHFINLNPQCFERSFKPGHLTASCWLWNYDQTACLFTHHKKLNKWLQLGGHADGDPDLLKVALKEAVEESGISQIEVIDSQIFDLSIHPIPENSKESAHLHYDVRFILKVVQDLPFIISDESNDLKWIPIEEMTSFNLDPSILKMKNKIQTLQVLKPK